MDTSPLSRVPLDAETSGPEQKTVKIAIAIILAGAMTLGACAQQPGSSSNATPLGDPRAETGSRTEVDYKLTAAGSVANAGGGVRAADAVATVNKQAITVEQLHRPLIEAYGLNILIHLAQLELCKQKAAAAGVVVRPEDIAAERQRTLDQMFKEAVNTETLHGTDQEKEQFRQKEYERLLDQFFAARRVSRPEFDLAVQVTAYLRKLAEPGLAEQITDRHLQEGFNIMYGEKVRVRHIQLDNMRQCTEAQRRLREGEPFEKVASEMSTNARTRAAGGAVRPFSRAEPMWPDAFKDAAFSLKENEISDPVNTGDAIHLIKLEQRIPPSSAVKFEDHKEVVREQLLSGMIQVRIRALREQLAVETRQSLVINDPVLARQYQLRLEQAAGETATDNAQVRREIEADRPRVPAAQPEDLRPPATRPAQ